MSCSYRKRAGTERVESGSGPTNRIEEIEYTLSQHKLNADSSITFSEATEPDLVSIRIVRPQLEAGNGYDRR